MKRGTHSFVGKPLGARFTAAALAACLALPTMAAAQERTAFKVCADPNYLPYSNKAREGFENKLAEMHRFKRPTFSQTCAILRNNTLCNSASYLFSLAYLCAKLPALCDKFATNPLPYYLTMPP